jgi:HEAT repeat protein
LARRNSKHRVLTLLTSSDLDGALQALNRLPARPVINALFSFLLHNDQNVKWRAVTAMGAVVSNLADTDRENAREVMRRLMWSLNDESGSIGWGAPEAMGEIMACHEGLAGEYAHMLISYIREDGNYLEHELLQRGVIWGIGRLAQTRPHLAKSAVTHLQPYLKAKDAPTRGLTALTLGLLGAEAARPQILMLLQDHIEIQVYLNGAFANPRVSDLAKQALTILDTRPNTHES